MDWFFFFVEMMSVEKLTLLVSLLETLISSAAYPLSIFGVFYLFRTPIRNLIGRIKEGEFAGNKVSFREQQASNQLETLETKVERQKETITAIQNKVTKLSSDDKEDTSLDEVKKLTRSLLSDVNTVETELYSLARVLDVDKPLRWTDIIILKALAGHIKEGGLSLEDISKHTGISTQNLKQRLTTLLSKKYIRYYSDSSTQSKFIPTSKGSKSLGYYEGFAEMVDVDISSKFKDPEKIRDMFKDSPPPEVD